MAVGADHDQVFELGGCGPVELSYRPPVVGFDKALSSFSVTR